MPLQARSVSASFLKDLVRLVVLMSAACTTFERRLMQPIVRLAVSCLGRLEVAQHSEHPNLDRTNDRHTRLLAPEAAYPLGLCTT